MLAHFTTSPNEAILDIRGLEIEVKLWQTDLLPPFLQSKKLYIDFSSVLVSGTPADDDEDQQGAMMHTSQGMPVDAYVGTDAQSDVQATHCVK